MLIQGQRDSLTIAGRVLTDLTNLITLKGYVNGTGTGSTGLVDSTGNARVVTVGKKFKVIGIKLMAAVDGYVGLGYCDNALGQATATAPINPVSSFPGRNIYTGAANTRTEISFDFEIPAGKYLYITNGGSAAVSHFELLGYEVPA